MNKLQELSYALYDNWRTIDILYEEYAKSYGISYTSMKVLYCIYKAKDAGCTQKQICEKTELPKQTIHSIIQSFLKQSWITMNEAPEDHRHKTLSLSAAGQEFYTETFERMERAEMAAFSCMDESDARLLIRLLGQYADKLAETLNSKNMD